MDRWSALWVLGVVLLLTGTILLFVPALPQQSHSMTIDPQNGAPQRWHLVMDNVSGFSITGTIPVLISWSSGAALYLDYAICHSPPPNANAFDFNENLPGCDPWVYGVQGSTDSISVSQPNGGSVVLEWASESWGPSNFTMSYSIWTGITIAGPVLLTLGAISIGLGVVLLFSAEKTEIIVT